MSAAILGVMATVILIIACAIKHVAATQGKNPTWVLKKARAVIVACIIPVGLILLLFALR
jgi:hypothetical protein